MRSKRCLLHIIFLNWVLCLPSSWLKYNFHEGVVYTAEPRARSMFGDPCYISRVPACGPSSYHHHVHPHPTCITLTLQADSMDVVVSSFILENIPLSIEVSISCKHFLSLPRCSDRLKGRNMMQECEGDSCSLRECRIDPSSGLYEQGCLFWPEKDQNVQESIMYSAALPFVSVHPV